MWRATKAGFSHEMEWDYIDDSLRNSLMTELWIQNSAGRGCKIVHESQNSGITVRTPKLPHWKYWMSSDIIIICRQFPRLIWYQIDEINMDSKFDNRTWMNKVPFLISGQGELSLPCTSIRRAGARNCSKRPEQRQPGQQSLWWWNTRRKLYVTDNLYQMKDNYDCTKTYQILSYTQSLETYRTCAQ